MGGRRVSASWLACSLTLDRWSPRWIPFLQAVIHSLQAVSTSDHHQSSTQPILIKLKLISQLPSVLPSVYRFPETTQIIFQNLGIPLPPIILIIFLNFDLLDRLSETHIYMTWEWRSYLKSEFV
jgi:hypothetical protein